MGTKERGFRVGVFVLQAVFMIVLLACCTVGTDLHVTGELDEYFYEYEDNETGESAEDSYGYKDSNAYMSDEVAEPEKSENVIDADDELGEIFELISEYSNKWTVEELGETIVNSGAFWEEWWDLRGRFDSEHFISMFEKEEYVPEYIRTAYARLLPTSGFESLSDIHNYLLQYYTEAWVEKQLSGGIFLEYNDKLYMDILRAGFVTTSWETATHALIKQDDNHAVVQTTALRGPWYLVPWYLVPYVETEEFFRKVRCYFTQENLINPDILMEEIFNDVEYYFIFINGRINNIIVS